MDILHNIIKKCKSKQAFDVLIIVLVATSSFGLGKLSEISKNDQNVPQNQLANVNLVQSESEKNEVLVQGDGQVVASKNGTKYHLPWCTGALQIAEKNKIWFNSIKEAREAGYLPASNCKGLE